VCRCKKGGKKNLPFSESNSLRNPSARGGKRGKGSPGERRKEKKEEGKEEISGEKRALFHLALGLRTEFEFDNGGKGREKREKGGGGGEREPSPETIDHMSFHCRTWRLTKALAHLKRGGGREGKATKSETKREGEEKRGDLVPIRRLPLGFKLALRQNSCVTARFVCARD